MKLLKLVCVLISFLFAQAGARNVVILSSHHPEDIQNIKDYIPQAQVDIRYFSSYNFVGRPIAGYKYPFCLLTLPAIYALQKVEHELLLMGLTLKVYDCYRPQQAVDDFANWAKNLQDIRMKDDFYPAVDKKDLFKDGYIAFRSGHSRGSTLDVTIVPIDSAIPVIAKGANFSCTNSYDKRAPDNSLDFGTGFDCFSPISYPHFIALHEQARANRLLLALLMKNAGFIGIDTEWWHFTLKNEPYPNTYFNFPVKNYNNLVRHNSHHPTANYK